MTNPQMGLKLLLLQSPKAQPLSSVLSIERILSLAITALMRNYPLMRSNLSAWHLNISLPCTNALRFYPPDRDVLRYRYSFSRGAKIGVLGANGAGKSSLLKIMAGIDDGFSGEARLTPPYTVGFLPQEPELNPEKTVYENVMDGVGEVADLLTRYDADFFPSGLTLMLIFEKLGSLQSSLEKEIETAGAGSSASNRNSDGCARASTCGNEC